VTQTGIDNLGILVNLHALNLIGSSTTDADLFLLTRFPTLEVVQPARSHLTDRGVQVLSTLSKLSGMYCDGVAEAECNRIANLSQLHALSIGGAQVNDVCLESLAKLSNLNVLGLYNTSVTDEGIARLPVVTPRLLSLVVSGAPVGDAGLEKLSALTTLANLWMYDVKVSDAGLKHLKLLTTLRQLGLHECRIGDAGLENLGSLVDLEALHLNGTDITNEGLRHLRRLTNLKLLELINTRITETAVAELKEALPDCKIGR
jgi:Leucine-rich repeat (LRR) protein